MSDSNISVGILFFLCVGVVILAPLPAHPVDFKLKQHPIRLVELVGEGKRYWHDDRIKSDDAKALYRHFRKKSDDPVPEICGVPGMNGYFVVSSWDSQSTEADFGRRLYLVRKTGVGFEDVDRTRGAGDSYILSPAFYTGHGKIVILAEIGTEYSWGLVVFEVTRKRLVPLGSIDAAVEGELDAEDPTPFAAVKYENNRWRVEFSNDLVLDPGG